MYLIDTDVLSLLRRPERSPAVARWITTQADAHLHLSAVTLGEVSRGIELKRPRDPSFAADLAAWLAAIQTRYAERVLPFGPAEAVLWGRLCAAVGHVSVDLMIAATAKERGLTVVTRNLRHYIGTNVPTIDPAGDE
jgi:predicted nucleic acid-binding protein